MPAHRLVETPAKELVLELVQRPAHLVPVLVVVIVLVAVVLHVLEVVPMAVKVAPRNVLQLVPAPAKALATSKYPMDVAGHVLRAVAIAVPQNVPYYVQVAVYQDVLRPAQAIAQKDVGKAVREHVQVAALEPVKQPIAELVQPCASNIAKQDAVSPARHIALTTVVALVLVILKEQQVAA